MKILIANMDFVNDPYNLTLDEYLDGIRKDNINGWGSFNITDPFGEEKGYTLDDFNLSFGYARTEDFNGIILMGSREGALFTNEEGFPKIACQTNWEVDPSHLPFLSQETLVAYMPQIPWDDFGNHLRLEGDDAQQLMALYDAFFKQYLHLFDAVNKGNYPLDTSKSAIKYIFMDENKI